MKMVILLDVSATDGEGVPLPDEKVAAQIRKWAVSSLTNEQNLEVNREGLSAVVKSCRVVATEL